MIIASVTESHNRRGRFSRAEWTRISQLRDVEFNFVARSIIRSFSLSSGITTRAKVAGNSRTNGGDNKSYFTFVASLGASRCNIIHDAFAARVLTEQLNRSFRPLSLFI